LPFIQRLLDRGAEALLEFQYENFYCLFSPECSVGDDAADDDPQPVAEGGGSGTG